MINITNLSKKHPFLIEEKQYDQLKNKTQPGWTYCNTEEEWLTKLHYLRSGYKQGKIDKANFFKKEQELVLKWWGKFCR